MKKLALALALVLLAAPAAFAQVTADRTSADGTAKASIIVPIALANAGDLQFGQIVAGSGGTVTVDPNSNVTSSGVTFAPATLQTAAIFNVSGQNGNAYSIESIGATTISNGSGATMDVDSFATSKDAGTLSESGTDSFTVGATLHVASNQAAGNYAGSFMVFVHYN